MVAVWVIISCLVYAFDNKTLDYLLIETDCKFIFVGIDVKFLL